MNSFLFQESILGRISLRLFWDAAVLEVSATSRVTQAGLFKGIDSVCRVSGNSGGDASWEKECAVLIIQAV